MVNLRIPKRLNDSKQFRNFWQIQIHSGPTWPKSRLFDGQLIGEIFGIQLTVSDKPLAGYTEESTL